MGIRKARKSTFKLIVCVVILPLVIINCYAYWKLSETAGHWALAAIPASVPETLTQLAIILAINNAAIVFLLIYIRITKRR